MIINKQSTCPICGGNLKYYDSVKRIMRLKNGKIKQIILRRLRCIGCNTLHREIPDRIFPYKHYEKEIILGVINGDITSEMLDYENYPCELTMINWKKNWNKIVK